MKKHNKTMLIGLVVVAVLVGATSYFFSFASGQMDPRFDFEKVEYSFWETKIAKMTDPAE